MTGQKTSCLELSSKGSVLSGKLLVSSLSYLSRATARKSGDLSVESSNLGLIATDLSGIRVDLSGQLGDPESQSFKLLGINLSLEEGVESLELHIASPKVVNLDLQGIHGGEVDSDELLSDCNLLCKLQSKSSLSLAAALDLSSQRCNLGVQVDGSVSDSCRNAGYLSCEGLLLQGLGSDSSLGGGLLSGNCGCSILNSRSSIS